MCACVHENVSVFLCLSVWIHRYDVESQGRGPLCVQRLLGLLCFVAGLALTNQHTSILLIAPLALWVLVTGAQRHGWTATTLGKLFLA